MYLNDLQLIARILRQDKLSELIILAEDVPELPKAIRNAERLARRTLSKPS